MKGILAVTFATLCLVIPAVGQSKTDAALVIDSAEIVKVDAKKKMLQVRELVAPPPMTPPRRGDGGGSGGGRSGGSIPFPGGRTGGNRVPLPTGGGGGGGRPRTREAKEYKVFVTKDTVLQFAGTEMEFSDFRVGDRVTLAGIPKGSTGDLEATRITRE